MTRIYTTAEVMAEGRAVDQWVSYADYAEVTALRHATLNENAMLRAASPASEPQITKRELMRAINALGLDNDLKTPDWQVADIIFEEAEKRATDQQNEGRS